MRIFIGIVVAFVLLQTTLSASNALASPGSLYMQQQGTEEEPVVIPTTEPLCVPIPDHDCGIGAQNAAIAQATATAVARQQAQAAAAAAQQQTQGQQQDQPADQGCLVSFDLPWTHVCVQNPINWTWLNNWLLEGARSIIRSLREILDSVSTGPLDFITQTPLSIWDASQLTDARNLLILIVALIAIPMVGLFQGIVMLIQDLGWGFWKEDVDLEEIFAHFLLGALVPLASFGFFEFLVGLNNQFCQAMGISLSSAVLAEPQTDSFIVLLLVVGVQLVCFIVIGAYLAVRFFVVVVLGMISILASVWIIRPEWKPYFKQFWMLAFLTIFFQLAVMGLLWFNAVIVRTAAGEGVMSFVQMIFTLVSTVAVVKSRHLIIPLVKQAGLHEVAIWQRYLITPVLRQLARRRTAQAALAEAAED